MKILFTWNNIITWVLISIVVLLFSIYKDLLAWLRTTLLVLKLKGPKPLPFVGNALLIQDSKALWKISRNCKEKYGPIFRAWISLIPIVVIFQPDHVQAVLCSSKQTDKNFLYTFMHNFIGEGLITNNGQKWLTHRKYIQPYFNIIFLEKSIKIFNKHSKVFVRTLSNDIRITNQVNDCVLNLLHEIVFGPGIEIEDSPFRNGKLMLKERLTKPWLLFEPLYKISFWSNIELTQKSRLRNFTKKILDKKLTSEENNNDHSLMYYFIKISRAHSDFKEDDIINEACTFMLAGQDSVASAISFTIYFLAKYKEFQEKARDEVLLILEICDDNPKLSDLNNMKYLGCCIKEALRLCPSVPIIARRLSEDLQLGNYILPKDCNVFITPFVTHILPDQYPNPEEYNPDRFLQENVKNRHAFSFIPFSGGPRNCLGYKFAMLEMKSVIARLLKNFVFTLDPKSENLNLLYRITLRAKGGIWVRLEKR